MQLEKYHTYSNQTLPKWAIEAFDYNFKYNH